MSRSIHFSTFFFVLLFALVLLVSAQLSRLSVPYAMPESWRAIDRAALEEVPLASRQSATKNDRQPVSSTPLIEDRKRVSDIGWLPDLEGSKEPASGERVNSSLADGINRVGEKQDQEASRPKNQVKSAGYRPRVNLVTHSHGPKVSERRLAHSGNGPSWQKIRSDVQRLKRRITRWLRPAWRRGGRYALGR